MKFKIFEICGVWTLKVWMKKPQKIVLYSTGHGSKISAGIKLVEWWLSNVRRFPTAPKEAK